MTPTTIFTGNQIEAFAVRCEEIAEKHRAAAFGHTTPPEFMALAEEGARECAAMLRAVRGEKGPT